MFHFFFMQKISENQIKKNNPIIQKEKSSPKKFIQELSPKTKKMKEHTMNRVKSMDNFMKFSWSWTL